LPRDIINPPGLPALNPTYSQAIRANGFVFVAGQIGNVPGTGKLVSDDIAEQARQALDNTATVLEAAGSSLSKVVSSSLFLMEFHQLSRVNAIYSIFPSGRAGQVRVWRHNTLRRREIRNTGHCTGIVSNRPFLKRVALGLCRESSRLRHRCNHAKRHR
jgi:2-iminobutanoate/2-iminopropanoate deaminase